MEIQFSLTGNETFWNVFPLFLIHPAPWRKPVTLWISKAERRQGKPTYAVQGRLVSSLRRACKNRAATLAWNPWFPHKPSAHSNESSSTVIAHNEAPTVLTLCAALAKQGRWERRKGNQTQTKGPPPFHPQQVPILREGGGPSPHRGPLK